MRRDDVASTSVRRHFDVMCPLGLVSINIVLGHIVTILATINHYCNVVVNRCESRTYRGGVLIDLEESWSVLKDPVGTR